jgi:signal transduction histidine kinase/CheY-like chemotaxis protein
VHTTPLACFEHPLHGTFPVEISLSPVTTARGRFVSSAIRNVTDHKAIERKLVEAREFAERANRAKSAFLAAASHDLRQPLQTLTLLTTVLSRIVPTDSKAATAVANQSEALRAMAELLNSLLDISKLEAGVVKPDITDCSVGRIFARLRSEFAALAESKGLDLIVEDSSDVVRTDPTLLGQIIQNLLANAIRYTREGWVRLRCIATLQTVRIEVSDTGIGIPTEELDLIFDEYYQTSRNLGEARQGVGLGLSIARRVAGLLGCSLDVTSTLGRGSCFTVGVPRSGEWTVAATGTPKAATGIARDGALVLVVDDEIAVADATALLLGTAGMEVLIANSSQQALDQILDRERAPDLLICDYHLGRKETGIEVIRLIREATRDTVPTILVSGDTSTAIVNMLNGLDNSHLLSKPVDADELLELSARLLNGAGATTE